MPCELGFCTICGKETKTKCGTCGAVKLTDQYTEVEVVWTNGAKMKVGLCVGCATKNAHAMPDGKKAITDAHFDHWERSGGAFSREITVA